METILYAAGQGIWKIRGRPWAEIWEVESRGLEEERLVGVAVDAGNPEIVYAAGASSVWVSHDEGSTWKRPPNKGLGDAQIWTLAGHPQEPGTLLVGAAPAGLLVSEDWAESWQDRPSLREVPSAPTWTFPAPPYQPHVRTIAFAADRPDTIYAGIEIGGFLLSEDGGKTWKERNEALYPDIHSLTVHPTRPEIIFAMTGAGPYATADEGRHWRFLGRTLRFTYTVPCALHPDNPTRLYIAAAAGPPPTWARGGADAVIYRSDDQGETWEEIWAALPVGINGMIYRLMIDDRDANQIYAATTDGYVLLSVDAGEHWQTLPIRCQDLRDLSLIPGSEL